MKKLIPILFILFCSCSDPISRVYYCTCDHKEGDIVRFKSDTSIKAVVTYVSTWYSVDSLESDKCTYRIKIDLETEITSKGCELIR